MPKPAPVQEAILEFIRDYKRANDGNSPSYREIATALGKNAADIHRRVLVLERRGVIRISQAGRLCLVGGEYLPPE